MSYTEIDDPTAYFQSNLHTGNSGTNAITFSGNSDLQPDWIWIKERGATGFHVLTDTVRGITKQIYSNDTQTENTNSSSVTAIGSNGFTLGNRADVNNNSDTYVSWNWKAGTSVSGDTTGSGTAKTYTGSVNTDAGFSIIKYTGNGTSGHTIPHNLTQKPAMIIVKKLTGDNWTVYHHKIASDPATDYIFFNSTAAASDHVGYWNDTEPTSSVFTVGNDGGSNANDVSLIAYCFAEKQGYSKFGSYTGNGSTDGTFVYTGFKPAFVLVKQSSAAGEGWYLWDNKRDVFNAATNTLSPNSSSAEGAGVDMDILSNGFKHRYSGAASNSAATFIYMAFASNPFVTSTGVPATAR